MEHKEDITEGGKEKKTNLINGHVGSHLKTPRAAEELTNSEIEPYVSEEITCWKTTPSTPIPFTICLFMLMLSSIQKQSAYNVLAV